ncbi:MAG: hypothetical protein IKZ82_04640 [Clostridia bacterium]|nr:hypothetical protein [Clostridia bacterium]
MQSRNRDKEKSCSKAKTPFFGATQIDWNQYDRSEIHSYLQFKINELQEIISRADTKASIILASIGVFLGTAIGIKDKLISAKISPQKILNNAISFAFYAIIAFSVLSVVLGVLTLLNRNVSADESSTSSSIQDHLTNEIKMLDDLRNAKYKYFRLSLLSFAVTAFFTILLALSYFLVKP